MNYKEIFLLALLSEFLNAYAKIHANTTEEFLYFSHKNLLKSQISVDIEVIDFDIDAEFFV